MTNLVDEIQQFVHAAVDEAVNSAMIRQRSQHPRFVPGTIVSVSGAIAKVIPDDALVEPEDPEQFVEAVRLDWYQGVQGGLMGDRGRTILMTIPGGGVYCLGAIPPPGEAFDETASIQSFFRSTASDSARAAGVATDMTMEMDLTENHVYGVHLHAPFSCAANVFIQLTQDGTEIGQLWRAPAAASNVTADGWVIFEATEDIDGSVFTVINSSGSLGTITLQASATAPRTLLGLCLGPALRAVVDT